MRFPNESDAHATLFNLGRYAGARVRADPAARPLAELIRAPQGKLKDSVVARNQAEDALTDAEAERDFELDGFAEQVLDLGRHAHAHFRSRQHEGYVRLFPERPSAIATTPERDREKTLAGFVGRVASKSTPAELAPQGKRVEAAWKRVQSAEATVAAARATLLAARSEEGKGLCRNKMRKDVCRGARMARREEGAGPLASDR